MPWIFSGTACTFPPANGCFKHWGGNQEGEGFEFHILAPGITFALMLKGAGALSVNGAFRQQLKSYAGKQDE